MPETIIPHPSGSDTYGRVMERKSSGVLIPGGLIFLKRGRYGRGGYGARHVWERHRKEMEKAGFESEDDVAAYVATIVCPGTPLFYEHGHMRQMRVTVVRGVLGTAILEHKPWDPTGPCYSVLTAFGQRNAIGSRIGSIAPVDIPKAEHPPGDA